MAIREQQSMELGEYQEQVEAGLEKLRQMDFAGRLQAKDPSIWKSEPEIQRAIANRLGWVDISETMRELVPGIENFVKDALDDGFTQALLMGMGGSSLCPEVCRITFGVGPGFPDLMVLDSTEPGMVLARERALDLDRTLFFVCSKSGTTAEINAFYRYFYERVRELTGEQAANQFVAITDPGTALENEAREKGFRSLFINPPDIGGRYSALSYFGLVPAATIGVDIEEMLDRVEEFRGESASAELQDQPAVVLGNAISQLALAGRDKLTFVLSDPIESFGDWVEQLIAESTGKEGKGIIPVVRELIGDPGVYSNDRVFVYIRLDEADNDNLDNHIDALEQAGHPVIRIRMRDVLDLGKEFYRWEVATATAGAVLGVNPFDEPNVKESKDNTNALLKTFTETGKLPEEEPIPLADIGVSLYADMEMLQIMGMPSAGTSLADSLKPLLRQLQPGQDYFAIMAFLSTFTEMENELQAIRIMVRNHSKAATTLGFGPRFLHSTGQLHKGGPDTGVFIQITRNPISSVQVPGEPFDFGALVTAQALGDFRALRSKNRRAIRLHITGETTDGLRRIREALASIY